MLNQNLHSLAKKICVKYILKAISEFYFLLIIVMSNFINEMIRKNAIK